MMLIMRKKHSMKRMRTAFFPCMMLVMTNEVEYESDIYGNP